jgi:hypothetical protein
MLGLPRSSIHAPSIRNDVLNVAVQSMRRVERVRVLKTRTLFCDLASAKCRTESLNGAAYPLNIAFFIPFGLLRAIRQVTTTTLANNRRATIG